RCATCSTLMRRRRCATMDYRSLSARCRRFSFPCHRATGGRSRAMPSRSIPPPPSWRRERSSARRRRWSPARASPRVALRAGAAGALALAVFVLSEPRCLGGPYALVDAGVRSVWLDRVNEMQSLFALMQTRPVTGLACAAFPATALAALAIAAPGLRRDFAFLTAGAAFLLALAIMFGMIKFYDYTFWLRAPLVAVAALDICRRLRLESIVGRFVVALLLTPVTVSVAAITIASAAGANTGAAVNPEREACLRRESYAALAQLPPGLVATNQVG